jgi:5-methylcytosine-specific restriction endonuclease McrA
MTFFDEPKRNHIPKALKEMLYTKQKKKCNYCGNEFSIQYFHIDHKTPIARGGSPDSITNLQLICGPCNTRKGKLTDGEFRKKYELKGSRSAKAPPSRKLSQSHFEKITKEIASKKAKKKKSDIGFGLF